MLRAYRMAIRALRGASRGSYLGPMIAAETLEEAFESTRGQDTSAIRRGARDARGECTESGSRGMVSKIGDLVKGALFQTIVNWMFKQVESWVRARRGSEAIEQETVCATEAIDNLDEQCQHNIQLILNQLNTGIQQILASLSAINPVLHPHLFLQCVQAGAALIDAAGSAIAELCQQRDALMGRCFEQLINACECECNQPEPEKPKHLGEVCEAEPKPEESTGKKNVSTPPKVAGGAGGGGSSGAGGTTGSAGGSGAAGTGPASTVPPQTHAAQAAPAAPAAPAGSGGAGPAQTSGGFQNAMRPGVGGWGNTWGNGWNSGTGWTNGSGSGMFPPQATVPAGKTPSLDECLPEEKEKPKQPVLDKPEVEKPAEEKPEAEAPDGAASECEPPEDATLASEDPQPCEESTATDVCEVPDEQTEADNCADSNLGGSIFSGVLGIVGIGVLAVGIGWVVQQIHEHVQQWWENVSPPPPAPPAPPAPEPTPPPAAPEPPPQQIKPMAMAKPVAPAPAPVPAPAPASQCEPPGSTQAAGSIRVQKAGVW